MFFRALFQVLVCGSKLQPVCTNAVVVRYLRAAGLPVQADLFECCRHCCSRQVCLLQYACMSTHMLGCCIRPGICRPSNPIRRACKATYILHLHRQELELLLYVWHACHACALWDWCSTPVVWVSSTGTAQLIIALHSALDGGSCLDAVAFSCCTMFGWFHRTLPSLHLASFYGTTIACFCAFARQTDGGA